MGSIRLGTGMLTQTLYSPYRPSHLLLARVHAAGLVRHDLERGAVEAEVSQCLHVLVVLLEPVGGVFDLRVRAHVGGAVEPSSRGERSAAEAQALLVQATR